MSFEPNPSLRDHLELTYTEIEEFNLEIKNKKLAGETSVFFEKKISEFLKKENRIKAVTIAFSDLEGRLQMLDYDKNFFLGSHDNLTFDGSSINGFTDLGTSDLRLKPDFSSFRILPSDIFGAGKVLIFGNVHDKDGSQFPSDFRGVLHEKLKELKTKKDYSFLVAPEVEGFLLEGEDAEQNYSQEEWFNLVTKGGYFNALPQDRLRKFIDLVAEAQRALGFENEKDHGEVAPSQFEINFKYSDALIIADQVLLYKLVARQVAKLMGCTASFLPKPVAGINGNGMHMNMSLSEGGKNVFYKEGGEDGLSELGQDFCHGVLEKAKEMNALYCSSVNSYRRLDPNFEAPNAIQKSACDRGSVIRIPLANEKSARIELRAVSPDSNPYLTFYAVLCAGLQGVEKSDGDKAALRAKIAKKPVTKLYSSLHDAISGYKLSGFLKEILGESTHKKYYDLKREVTKRSAASLGERVKKGEVVYHHEITNQVLWADF